MKPFSFSCRPTPACTTALFAAVAALGALVYPVSSVANYPVTPQQRSTAQQVARQGVALSELAPNAPDSYTVKRGDTLWDISRLFLKRPWRWPELWGMNLDQIRNPHLIYPGQVLYLDKTDGRARLRLGRPVGDGGTVRLSPQIRVEPLDSAIPALSLQMIEPFLNEAIILQSNELASAPRIVASQEGRVVMSRGDLAYVRGLSSNDASFRLFRQPKPLTDPITNEVLGYEAMFVGIADLTRKGEETTGSDGKLLVVPDTIQITTSRLEAIVGDRLTSMPLRDFNYYVPRAPQNPIDGRVVSVYGEALNAGQNQIISLNKGSQDGLEPGHVLSLLRAGRTLIDPTDPTKPTVKLPNEPQGVVMVFRVFDRTSYALILSAREQVKRGDTFTQPEQ